MDEISTKKLWMRDNIKPGMRCVDAGACIGLYTSYLSDLVGDTGVVYAFEPMLTNFVDLTKHIEGRNNIKLFHAGLGNETKKGAALFIAGNIGWNSFNKDISYIRDRLGGSYEESDIYKLDDILDTPQPIDFIKVDVESLEIDLLRGAEKIINNTKNMTIMMEAHLESISRLELFGTLREYDFKVFDLYSKEEVTPKTMGYEILAVRNV